MLGKNNIDETADIVSNPKSTIISEDWDFATDRNKIIKNDKELLLMNNTFSLSEIKQKKLIKKWLISEDEEFKKKNIIVTIFYVIAVIAFLMPPLYMYIKVPSERYSSETFMLSILFGAILGIVIFIIANSLKNKVYNDCGFPYTLERCGVIKLYEDGLEHMYHDASDKTWSESMVVYRIPKENINRILYYEECRKITIIGCGELITYDDYASKRINYQNSQRVFYNDSNYSFFLAIDESQQAQVIKMLDDLHCLEYV